MLFFFFNDSATTEIYSLSLHDALPISLTRLPHPAVQRPARQAGLPSPARLLRPRRLPAPAGPARPAHRHPDRKSTRLNSSHSQISYAVFCLKKKITESACCSDIYTSVI